MSIVSLAEAQASGYFGTGGTTREVRFFIRAKFVALLNNSARNPTCSCRGGKFPNHYGFRLPLLRAIRPVASSLLSIRSRAVQLGGGCILISQELHAGYSKHRRSNLYEFSERFLLDAKFPDSQRLAVESDCAIIGVRRMRNRKAITDPGKCFEGSERSQVPSGFLFIRSVPLLFNTAHAGTAFVERE